MKTTDYDSVPRRFLRTADGRDVLLRARIGMVYALDPDKKAHCCGSSHRHAISRSLAVRGRAWAWRAMARSVRRDVVARRTPPKIRWNRRTFWIPSKEEG